jgi:hypothetical protein
MGGLRDSSKVLQNLGQLHIVTGTITVSSGTWSLVSNDPTATITDDGLGNAGVLYEAFTAAPVCVVSMLKATVEAASTYVVNVESVTTTPMTVTDSYSSSSVCATTRGYR